LKITTPWPLLENTGLFIVILSATKELSCLLPPCRRENIVVGDLPVPLLEGARGENMEDWPYRVVAFAGFFIIAGIAWAVGSRARLNGKTLWGSLVLIWLMGGLTFWLPWSRAGMQWLNDVLVALLSASQKGNVFLFGPLALGPGQALPDGTASVGFVLAMQILPAVIFFSALVAGLYHLGIMQWVVRGFARIFYQVMGLSGAEALSASANIFVGVESGLTIQPYLQAMTRSELLTLLTCMMATVASTVLAIYVIALADVFPQIAGHLVSASIISIPCAILISKLSLPEDQTPETAGQLPEDREQPASREAHHPNPATPPSNLMMALIEGGGQGVKMAVSIATLLIVVLGLEAVADLLLAQFPQVLGAPLSITRLMGWLTWPFVILLGLRPEEWQLASEILGSRFVETEVAAYFTLAHAQAMTPPAFSLRSLTALTYALCGFVHLASMGIFVGGLAALIPTRVRDLSSLGLRALWTSFLATLLTGCVASVLA